MNNTNTTTTNSTIAGDPTGTSPGHDVAVDARHRAKILATIARKSFCVLASTSAANRAHAAGVVYAEADGALWVHARADSRKVRNVAANPWVGVTIPFRRLPFGPPYTIHFQARAEVVALDAPEVRALVAAGRLGAITGHGALEMPGACFVRIEPRGTIHSYGPGARLIDLIRDPLNHGAASFPIDHDGAR
ncbi:MAG: pyridoxamine 5'-phosphate oxidase family protein [Actinomycetota bacterium]